MGFVIYQKGIRTSVISGLLPAILMMGMALMMVNIWPEFKQSAEELNKLLEAPIYQAMLSEGMLDAGIGSYEGFMGMELFTILDLIYIVLAIFLGAGIIAREVDKKTLDINLSYPVPRWRLILEKFAVVNTYSLAIPIFLFFPIALGAIIHGEEINYLALAIALLARWLLFFTLSALSLLCATLFLRQSLSYSAAGGLVVGNYIMNAIGGLVESTKILQDLSLFYYLDGTSIWVNGSLPLVDLVIVAGVGILALLSSLVIFQKRELTY
ncbi:MAG: ABC transporter permease subunit [Promethearchaeota archaeon]